MGLGCGVLGPRAKRWFVEQARPEYLDAVGDYRSLTVWQEARLLAGQVYRIARSLPDLERYGLASQLRRASVSIISNIAEGSGRGSDREFVYFLRIARGSLHELQTQLILAIDLGYADELEMHATMHRADRVGRLIHGLARTLERR
ncbi:MAG TPA: four helix bundle protein [Gemmatimonadales bacterium]|nr:four helix bundle protein [Gemmatimonadales bacterium]